MKTFKRLLIALGCSLVACIAPQLAIEEWLI